MKLKSLILFLFTLSLMVGLSFPALSASSNFNFYNRSSNVKTFGQSEILTPESVTITFEGVGNNHVVGTQSGVVFAAGWYAVDSDAGGTGSFANEPSPDTTASPGAGWGVPDQSLTRITLPNSSNQVSFYYTLDTSLPTPSATVCYFNENDILPGTKNMNICGAQSCGNNCTGDPSGEFCSWQELTAIYNGIKYLEFGIDNFA